MPLNDVKPKTIKYPGHTLDVELHILDCRMKRVCYTASIAIATYPVALIVSSLATFTSRVCSSLGLCTSCLFPPDKEGVTER